MTIFLRRLVRPLSLAALAALILLGGLGAAAVVVIALGLLALPARVTTSIGRSAVVFAFPGVAFRAATPRTDASGWRDAYVLASKDRTLVLSAIPATQTVASRNGLNGLVTLSDTSGHSYAEQPDTAGDEPMDSSSHYYLVTVFPPLPSATTALLVHHNVPGGGTARVPVNLAQLGAVPQPVHPNVVCVSGRVSVTLTGLTRGALLSQVDISARGFADPGGEVSRVGNSGMMVRPPQTPAFVTMRTASGADLAPQIGAGPVDHGVVATTIGFRTPRRGAIVRLAIRNYMLDDLPPYRRVTRGSWVFTVRMP